MYAHQVLDDLGELVKFDSPITVVLKKYVPMIEKAHKFHLGNQYDTFRFFKGMLGKKLFSFYTDFLRLPFRICWFDYFNDSGEVGPGQIKVPKRGMLVNELADRHIAVQVFNCFTVKEEDEREPKWMMYGRDFHWFPSLYAYIVKLGDGEGKIMPLPIVPPEVADPRMFEPEVMSSMLRDDELDLGTLNNALLLLNCKNIGQEVVEPPERLNKKRIGQGKHPVYQYRTLNVKVPGSHRETRTDVVGTGRRVRVHYCRGHFKEFTAESRLFGKHVGLWWWQPTVKGGDEKKAAKKDYKISIREEVRA